MTTMTKPSEASTTSAPAVHPAFALMTAAATEAGLENFATDLTVHDAAALANAIEANATGLTFVWAVGKDGTFFTWTARGSRLNSAGSKLTATVSEMFPNMYAWDGSRLIAIDADTFTNHMNGEF